MIRFKFCAYIPVAYTPGVAAQGSPLGSIPREKAAIRPFLSSGLGGDGNNTNSKLQGGCGDVTWPGVSRKAMTIPGASGTEAQQ